MVGTVLHATVPDSGMLPPNLPRRSQAHDLLHMIEYLRERNRVLREQLGQRGLRLTDDPQCRLAAKANGWDASFWLR